MKNRIVGSIVAVAMLALGAGCGGTELAEPEQLQAPDMEMVVQAAEEEPRPVEDLMGGLDREQGVLHVEEGSVGIVLEQLKAQRVDETTYVFNDELSNEQTKFVVKPYPLPYWPTIIKRCPNGQLVFSWQKCPSLIYADPLIRIWRNASCNWKVQTASVGVCTNTSTGGSYRYYYLDAWKCGRGFGFCVERRAAMAIRYDYVRSACDPALISNVQSTNYNYLCKP
jgi:hypothetical protein